MIDWVRDWFRKGIIRGTGTEIPANKSLYDIIALDKLDSTTFGLSALKDLIDNLVDKDAAPTYLSYPDKANGVILATGTSAWTMPGSYTEIIPANTITETFWICGFSTYLFSSGGLTAQQLRHALEIGTGAAASETSILRVTAAARSVLGHSLLLSPLSVPIKVSANTRVAGRACDEDTTDRDLHVGIIYMTGV